MERTLDSFDDLRQALDAWQAGTASFWTVGRFRSVTTSGRTRYEPVAHIHVETRDATPRGSHLVVEVPSDELRPRLDEITSILEGNGVVLVHGKPPAVVRIV